MAKRSSSRSREKVSDRFLDAIEHIYLLRERAKRATDDDLRAIGKALGDNFASNWIFAARDAQLPPRDLDWCWLFLGGRGTGKSHSMSAAVHTAVRAFDETMASQIKTEPDEVWSLSRRCSCSVSPMFSMPSSPMPERIC